MIGRKLAHYTITAKIGEGGMGEVYRATDGRLKREVALKMLPSAVAMEPERLARFEREAQAIAVLNHPNVVTIYSVEEAEGVHLLTMELVDGQSLDHLLPPEGFPFEELLRIAIPLVDGLQAAHEAGIVHRDLKPANVMVTKQGRVKVLDFGLAKTAGGASSDEEATQLVSKAPLTGEGMVMGTVPYMAPEQLQAKAVDTRTDIFALGVVLYEMATGRRPFVGASNPDVISSILRDKPEPITRVRADLPEDLERIVSRCLEKNPKERPQSGRDVSRELRRQRRLVEYGELRAPEKPAVDRVASIAVLPFVNRSRNEEDEYFSDGLADELLNVLAKIKGLRVSARASSFQFKGKDEDLAVIGQKLNVATLLDGSVRKSGNRVRISVQLVKATDGYNLWSESYDRTLDDIFAVQDDIAQSVVKELRTTLLGEVPDSDARSEAKAEVARAARGRSTDPEAHRLYLLARHLLDRSTRESVAKAIEYLKQSLEVDPNFALGWTELSQAYSLRAGRGWAEGYTEGYGQAREAAERALALEPDLAEGHAQLAWIQIYHDRDWRGAQASYDRALELAPGSAPVFRGAGVLAYDLGHLEEAIRLYRRALDLDPLSSPAYSNLGLALHRADRFVEAEEAYRKALELAPQRATTHGNLAATLLAQGRGEEALMEARGEPALWSRFRVLAIIHHALGQSAESAEALRELIARHGEDSASQIAEVHGARGELDAAFEWLERAYAVGDPGLSEMKTNSCFRSLHGDPRWGAFLKKMGFEE